VLHGASQTMARSRCHPLGHLPAGSGDLWGSQDLGVGWLIWDLRTLGSGDSLGILGFWA